ncbi:MAG: amino acid adenylation domain-containing protein [Pseudomonadota bacterium]
MSPDPELATAPGLQAPEVAQRLAQLWGEQLKVPAASLDLERHFVDMGGYSLLVIVLLEAINREFGVEIALDAMVEHPSIAGLARHICATAQGMPPGAAAAAARPPGSAREFLRRDHARRFEPFDAPELLQAYWIGEQDVFEHGGPAFFYEEYAVDQLDIRRLDRALNKLIARHPGLRTIVLPDGRQQVVEFPSRFACAHHDLRGQGKTAFNDALTASRERLQRHPLDSGVFPLFSFTVLEGDEGLVVQVVGRLLVFDGVSWQIFASELQRLYDSDNTVLAPLELTVRDYTRAIEAFREKSDAYARSADYWRERVASLPEAPLLPRKPRARDTVRTPTLARRIFTLDAPRWSKLKAIMEERKLTPTALVCATFCSVIGAWSKLPQFTINVMYGNRQPIHADVDRVIGNFSTTLLLQVDNAAAATLFERAERLQKTMFRDLSHGTVSGVAVIRELNRHSAGSTVPKMPVVFSSFLGGVRDDREFFFLDKLGWKRLRGRINTPQVEFDHQVYVKNGELVLNWDVDESVYSPGMVDDMFAEYTRALVQLSEDPAIGQNAQLALVPPAQLLNRLAANNTDGPDTGTALLHAPFVRLAAEQGDRVAVIAADRTLSYRELGAVAAGIAAAIRQRRELSHGELVAVFLDKGWMEIAAVMGTLFAGGAYLPLASNTPVERLKYILQQANVGVVLTTAAKRAQLPAIDGLAVVAVDEVAPRAEGPAAGALGQSPSDLAYVIYTSGSTGNPKGVAITHEAAANTVLDINERFGAGPQDRCIAISALTFDLSVYDIFGMLSAGAAIVVPRQDDIKSPEALAGLVAAHGVSIWNTVPAFAEMLVEHAELHGQKLPSLRLVMASGDWVPVSLPERVSAAAGANARFIALGGATEASIWSNYYRVEGPTRGLPSIPYGYPLRNQRMYVLDHGHAFRPDWVPGEIFIAGVGLAQGYYKDPERTRQSFVESRRDGERLYRTGDWGRYLPSGAIEFLGRDDLQIKVRGYRIEIGEIESALARYAGVQEAAVVPVRQDKNVSHLVAFVTAQAQEPLDTEALRGFLGRHLPEYMIPSQIQCLAQLPRTDNAKIDRKALALLAAEGSENAADAEQPGTMAEVRLAAIWRELLQLPSVALNDNFFAVGGHSLLAVRLMGRIDVAFGKKLPLSALYADGTIKKLAARISGLGQEEFDALVVINKGAARAPLFCIHPIGGNVLCYAKLAGALDPQQPVYGLQSIGLGDAAAAHTGIGEMAAHYIARINSLVPEGPVQLLGWSMGGVVGYEIATQLAAAGRDTRLLMIDSWISRGGPAPDAEALMSDFMRDLTGTQASFEAPGAQALPQDADAELAQGPLYQVYLRNSQALQDYRPTPPSARMAIVQVRAAQLPEPTFPSLAPFVITDGQALRGPEAAPVVLPGDHYTLFRDDKLAVLVVEVKKFLVQKDLL